MPSRVNTRRTVRFITVVAVVFGLTGCSVPLTGVLGIQVIDDRVEAIVMMCPGYTADEVTIRHSDTSWAFKSTESAKVDLGTTRAFSKIMDDNNLILDVSVSYGGVADATVGLADIQTLADGAIMAGMGAQSAVVDAAGLDDLLAQVCETGTIPSKIRACQSFLEVRKFP